MVAGYEPLDRSAGPPRADGSTHDSPPDRASAVTESSAPPDDGIEYIEVAAEPEETAEPEEVSAESESPASQPADAAAADDDDLDDPDTLRELAKLGREWQAWAEEQKGYYQETQDRQAWAAQEAAYDDFLNKEVARLAQHIQQNYVDPNPALQQLLWEAGQKKAAWVREFEQSKQRVLQARAAQRDAILKAQDLCAQFNLPQSAANDLLTYPVDLMGREAKRMSIERQTQAALKRKATTESRKAKRAELAATNPAVTGVGRSDDGQTQRIPAGSTQHYLQMERDRPIRPPYR